MATMRFKELTNLSQDELKTKIRESEAQLFDARMKKATGQLEDTAMLWRLRKSLARMKMLDSSSKSSAEGKVEKAARQ